VARLEVWCHFRLGSFSVRLEEGVVTGIPGPLCWHHAVDYGFDPAGCSFDGSKLATRVGRTSLEQFVPSEKWLRGGTDYRPRPLAVEMALGHLVERAFFLLRRQGFLMVTGRALVRPLTW
jgi:hypothetical protein